MLQAIVDAFLPPAVALKPVGGTLDYASAAQMRALADIAERYRHDEIRVSHEHNAVLPHLALAKLTAVFDRLRAAAPDTANVDLITDIIACPGMDDCSLVTARSIQIAQDIARRFNELQQIENIGRMKIKISGCISACGHHHVGDIGFLGLDRTGKESHQITLGVDAAENARIGARAGPGLAADKLVPALERLIRAYLDLRENSGDSFASCFRRPGPAPFQDALYPEWLQRAA